MNNSHEKSFGIVIAYLLPGFVAARGVGYISVDLASWLAVDLQSEPVLAGFLFAGMASLTLGLIVSGLRWAMVDTAHHIMDVKAPVIDFGLLQENLAAFELAVEHNYRYYQFYANMFVAIAVFVACHLASAESVQRPILTASGIALLELVLFWASRDCLRRYYARVGQILRREGRVRPLPPGSP